MFIVRSFTLNRKEQSTTHNSDHQRILKKLATTEQKYFDNLPNITNLMIRQVTAKPQTTKVITEIVKFLENNKDSLQNIINLKTDQFNKIFSVQNINKITTDNIPRGLYNIISESASTNKLKSDLKHLKSMIPQTQHSISSLPSVRIGAQNDKKNTAP